MVVSGPAAGPPPQDDPAGGLGLDADRREPTMTLPGWRRFVDAPAARFELLPEERWAALAGPDKEAYDEARLNYHSEMIIVATSTIREVARQGRLLTLLNRREIGARRGLIVSGQQTTGKTTALKQLGRTHELMVRQRYPARLADRIPVVYVTTPPKGSPRKLAMEFARFLGLPPAKRGYNTTDIADAVCQIMLEARVDLVLVDELHNLNLATAAGEDMSDHLKYFTEHLPATFAYAGIDVERRVFTGVRGKQIAGRCVLINTGPFPCDAEWRGLVATLESALRLHRHQPGSLTRQARYLHRRTGGMIGSLSHLVRAAAQLAILEGGEVITRKLMDTIPVDHAAESGQYGAA
jgi:AAA domain